MSSLPTTIPPASWVLITGANGFLASHVALQFLHRGFRVRGTVRDVQQSAWMLKGQFQAYADNGNFELVSVPDFSIVGAFDAAVKDVAAILHIAYVTRIVPDPNEVITPTVAGIQSIMTSAINSPSVKQIVFTSSAMAATPLTQTTDNGTVGRDSWNDAALEAAWAPPPYGMAHAMANYPASKAAAEKEVWRLVEDKKPQFTVNVVSPAGIIGEPLNSKHIEGQANWIVHGYRGNKMVMDSLQATFYADVKDLATIHLAAVLDPEVSNARLQSWGHSVHWNDILPIMREIRPQRSFVEDYPDSYHLTVDVDQAESVALLKKWAGREGWTPLREAVKENIVNQYLEV